MRKRDIPNPFGPDFIKGGPGSGNFGHRGRPGIRGGSAKDGGGAEAPKSTSFDPDEAFERVASGHGFVTLPDGRKFTDVGLRRVGNSDEHYVVIDGKRYPASELYKFPTRSVREADAKVIPEPKFTIPTKYSNQDFDEIGQRAAQLTEIDRAAGRKVPAGGYSKENYLRAQEEYKAAQKKVYGGR